jgi:hypothetical protein
MRNGKTVNSRLHHKHIAPNTMKLLWRRKLVIPRFVLAFPALVFFVLMGPQHTAEAMIDVGSSRNGGSNTNTQDLGANVEAAVLVDSAARFLRSRQIAGTWWRHLAQLTGAGGAAQLRGHGTVSSREPLRDCSRLGDVDLSTCDFVVDSAGQEWAVHPDRHG